MFFNQKCVEKSNSWVNSIGGMFEHLTSSNLLIGSVSSARLCISYSIYVLVVLIYKFLVAIGKHPALNNSKVPLVLLNYNFLCLKY